MNVRFVPLALAAMVLSACGGSSSGSTTTPTTTAASAVTTTTTLKRVIVLPSTTTIAVTRDSRLALGRCTDALGPLFAESVALDPSRLDTARSACDDAKLQLEADGVAVLDYSQPGSDLLAALEFMNLTMSFAALKVAGDSFDATAQVTLQKAADEFDAKVEKLLPLLL